MNHRYAWRCGMCGASDDRCHVNDDTAFNFLQTHSVSEHPEVGFCGGELIPLDRVTIPQVVHPEVAA